MSLNGIDTSKWQSGLPDATINAAFIIFKATEGVGYIDPDCNASYQESKAAGKLLGVYHFARPDYNDPISEANFFVDNIQGYIGEAMLVLDWECEPKNNVAWAKQWLDHVYARTGVKPVIYMSESVVNSYDWSSVANADYGLWVARYRDNIDDYDYDMTLAGDYPSVNWWAQGYCMWQWTSNGHLAGWGGDLDLDIFFGDDDTWRAYTRAGGAVVAPQPVSSNATIDQIKALYLEILDRPADDEGINHYLNYSLDFVRNDLAASQERANLILTRARIYAANKAAEELKAAQEATRIAEEAAKANQEPVKETPVTPPTTTVAEPTKGNDEPIKAENPFMYLLRLFLGVLSKLITKSKK